MRMQPLSLPSAIALRYFSLCILTTIVVLARTPLAFAQHPEISNLAVEVGQDLAEKKIEMISVSFFRFEKGGISEAGRALSLEFSAALGKAEPQIQIIDSGRLKLLAEERGILPYDVFQSEVARQLSATLGAKVQIRGTLKELGDSIRLDLQWVDARGPLHLDGKWLSPKRLGSASTTLAQTPELTALLSRPNSEDSSGFLIWRAPGTTEPKCIYCAQPNYSDKARKARIQGNLLVLVTVTSDGSVVNPLFLNRLDPGLDEATLNAFQRWRLKPGKDGNGKPGAMRIEVEITFRLL
jgi:TonB family protein